MAFGEYGGVASTICNNLIADLLFLRKCHMHLLSRCSALGPGPGSFFPPKHHPIGDVALKLGEGEIPVGILGMLAKWSAVIADAVENVQNGLFC